MSNPPGQWPQPADALSGLMPPGDRDLRRLRVEAQDQIQMDNGG
jgi:hypothetical protein